MTTLDTRIQRLEAGALARMSPEELLAFWAHGGQIPSEELTRMIQGLADEELRLVAAGCGVDTDGKPVDYSGMTDKQLERIVRGESPSDVLAAPRR